MKQKNDILKALICIQIKVDFYFGNDKHPDFYIPTICGNFRIFSVIQILHEINFGESGFS